MNLKFVVNDYVLIWNLLFQASVSDSMHKLKQKIWVNYKNEYNKTFKDNPLILKDPKNFIPNDDTIYNIILENEEYEEIRKETEKYRVKLLKVWDDNKKIAVPELKNILRFDIKLYNILVVYEKLNIVDTTEVKDSKVNAIVWGKYLDETKPLATIVKLAYIILRKEMRSYHEDYKSIVDAVIELAILNEFATKLSGVSNYLTGNNALKYIKKQIYPYWLMYLGVQEKEINEYMMRDNIFYNVEEYEYQPALKKMDLYGFIDFCIENHKDLIKEERINEVEVL